MALSKPSTSKKAKPSFFERKMDAFRAFGKAQTRPQSNFREYLLEKRQLNFGVIKRENLNLLAIVNYGLNYSDLNPAPSSFPEMPTTLSDKLIKIVTENYEFDEMFQDLVNQTELAIDLEGNSEHSFYGMTCLIQIGTYDKIYLVDPFSQFENVKSRLKRVLESAGSLKLTHGGDNDYLWLNRDFGISAAGGLDLQFLQQELYIAALKMIDDNNVADERLMMNKQLWNLVTDQKGNLLPKSTIEKMATERMGLKNMAKLYFPKHAEPADATLADWRIRPLCDPKMINYAAYDVYMLLHIWNNVKHILQQLPDPDSALKSAIEKTKNLLKKHFVPLKQDSLYKKLHDKKLVPANPKMDEWLYEYRQNRAKIVDENPDELLTLTEINAIIKANPTDKKQIVDIVQRRRKIPSESIEETSDTILKILERGEPFIKQMKETKCHVCNGKYEYPHVAWGCCEKYSQQAVNAYMGRPENAAFKQKEDERRREKWYLRHGPNVAYPYGRPN